jgi:hypothetical protein
MAVTGSSLVAALPFSASLAWTAVTLLCCSRLFAAHTWARRLVWIGLAAVAWGQIVAAHAGLGALMGTITLVAYLAFGSRRAGWPYRTSLIAGSVFVASALCVNLLFLAPRLAYESQTSLSLGYWRLGALGRALFGLPPATIEPGQGAGPGWPLVFSSAPGAYLGAAVLLGVLLAFLGRRRALAWPFLLAGVIVYLLSLAVVADAIPGAIGHTAIVDLYLHAPYWMGYELVLVFSVLGAIGIASWSQIEERMRWAAVGVAAVVWLGLPLLLGEGARTPLVAAVGTVAVVALLWLSERHRAVLYLLPVILVGELLLASVAPASDSASKAIGPIPVNVSPLNHFPLIRPVIFNHSRFQEALTSPGGGRYILINSSRAAHEAQPHGVIDGATEPAWFLNWALLTGAQSVQSYRAVVPLRYWTFVRAMGAAPSNYEHIRFLDVPPVLANLLAVGWVVRPVKTAPQPGERLISHTRHFALYRRTLVAPPATLISSWMSVPTSDAALAFIRRPDFDPSREAVIESSIPLRSSPVPALASSVRYTSASPGTATISVSSAQQELLLIRTPYLEGWHATVDGRATQVFATDYVDQGVRVPPGRHTVRLTYEDPWVVRGIWLTVLSLVGIAVAALACARLATRTS